MTRVNSTEPQPKSTAAHPAYASERAPRPVPGRQSPPDRHAAPPSQPVPPTVSSPSRATTHGLRATPYPLRHYNDEAKTVLPSASRAPLCSPRPCAPPPLRQPPHQASTREASLMRPSRRQLELHREPSRPPRGIPETKPTPTALLRREPLPDDHRLRPSSGQADPSPSSARVPRHSTTLNGHRTAPPTSSPLRRAMPSWGATFR
jgi:hypothetical protein